MSSIGGNRFSALNRPNFNGSYSSFGGGIAGGSFSGLPPAGFGGVGSFNSFGGGFNNFANPYAFGGGFGGGGGGAAAWTQFALITASVLPMIIQGFQNLFQLRHGGDEGQECGECSEDQQGRSDDSDVRMHEIYQDGQSGHRINESGVNMSFETDDY